MSTNVGIGPFHLHETWELDIYCRERSGLPMNMDGGTVEVQFFEDDTEEAPLFAPAFMSNVSPGWSWRDRPKGFARLSIPPSEVEVADLGYLLQDGRAYITYKVTAFPADGRTSVQAKGRCMLRR